MNFKLDRMVFIVVLIFAICLCLSACGGGGGSDGGNTTTPTDPNQSFSLSKLQSTTLGTIYSTQLTGSDTDGITYTGALSIANREQTMLGGLLVTPQDLIISLTDDEGFSITLTGTSYFDTSGDLISTVIQTTGLVCMPGFSDNMPTSVKIGDFGILSTLTCSDNTTQERNWRVEDAGNGKIRVISNGTVKDQLNEIVSLTDVTFTIDGSGNIVAFKTKTTQLAYDFTLTYQSI